MGIFNLLGLIRRILFFSILLSLAWKLSSMIVLPASSPAPLPVNLAPVALPDHPVPEINRQKCFYYRPGLPDGADGQKCR